MIIGYDLKYSCFDIDKNIINYIPDTITNKNNIIIDNSVNLKMFNHLQYEITMIFHTPNKPFKINLKICSI